MAGRGDGRRHRAGQVAAGRLRGGVAEHHERRRQDDAAQPGPGRGKGAQARVDPRAARPDRAENVAIHSHAWHLVDHSRP